ncbi:hypothetical protein L873DRAFT_915094 [Choiromyces venosus 120613-1]|uniref:ER transporter 6TM N-terminal domain-containing protein n=1 Tax=Choiromyces venosus 120613-1 TaxID=1336337 RepID=A0A3N4JT21_9PEZI|nr:hypothetical protein L873DRAFT_915094 [Choiromyces venosus 120613-1]
MSLHQTLSPHVQLDERALRRREHNSRERPSVYSRSRNSQSSFRSGQSRPSRAASRATSGARTPIDPSSPRASVSTLQLQHLLENLELDQYNTYGVEELRDGLFDASFYRPIEQNSDEAEPFLPPEIFTFKRPWSSSKSLIHSLAEDVKFFFRLTFKTEQGFSLAKSFLAYFVGYILCLVPRSRGWLGRYPYWITVAILFTHPGRTLGAQIDATVACSIGAAFGLAVGSLALEVASSTHKAQVGHGGVIAVFWVLFIGAASWIRCSLMKLYQSMISVGLAVIFLCLVGSDAIDSTGNWDPNILWEFGIPWVVGLGICLIINIVIRPDAGGKAVAAALHKAVISAMEGLVLPRPYSPATHQNMNHQLVNLSEAIRDMRGEIVISYLRPDDAEQLRNLMQAVIRDIMAIKPDGNLFEDQSSRETGADESDGQPSHSVVIEIEPPGVRSPGALSVASSTEAHLKIVRDTMEVPARELINAMSEVLLGCDKELMNYAGHKKLLGSSQDYREINLESSRDRLHEAMRVFDESDISLIDHQSLPSAYSAHPELVEMFLFIHPLRQTADSLENLAKKVLGIVGMQRRKRIFLPSYPLHKALYRTNPQVRHDRGGLTAGYYFKNKQNIEKAMETYQAKPFILSPTITEDEKARETEPKAMSSNPPTTAEPQTLRYRAWRVLHRLQQWEARFAFKVVFVTILLSIPAWLGSSRVWYLENECWWSVIAAWFMMHPQVGGNAQDLITRSAAAAIGSIWAGLGHAAGGGNPYVLAVFMAIFMVPCIFRFTSSSHPRSGLMGCISYSVVSLGAHTLHNSTIDIPSPAKIAWTRGVSLIVGIVTAVVVNWVIWPFVARHELRKSLSFMMLNLGISYRGVVARYDRIFF